VGGHPGEGILQPYTHAAKTMSQVDLQLIADRHRTVIISAFNSQRRLATDSGQFGLTGLLYSS
jgi:hypothetical protein